MKSVFRALKGILRKEPVIALGAAAPFVVSSVAYFGFDISLDEATRILGIVGLVGTVIARNLVRPEADIPDHIKPLLDAKKG